MPIRLNLLAEAQALEEMRRRDPVKRALWIAALLIALMLVWASSLQLKAMLASNDLGRVEGLVNSGSAKYKQVVESRKKIAEANQKLAALHSISTNRFLNGTLLNTLQQATLEDIHLVHLKVDQLYVVTEETKARTNANKVVSGKPATMTEKISLTLDGSDTSASPGDQVAKFKDVLAVHSYFNAQLGPTNQLNLINLTAPQMSPDSGRAYVQFTIECRYPEITR
jgi:hypothetical protein